MPKLFKNILLETKLDEAANMYDGLLMSLESIVRLISIKETHQYFRKKGIKIKNTISLLENQIITIDIYFNKLTCLNDEIIKHDQIALCSITGIDENRDRVIKAFRTLNYYLKIKNDITEKIDLINYMEHSKTAINLALSILRINRTFQYAPAFQDIDEIFQGV